MTFAELVVNMPPIAVAEIMTEIVSIDYPYEYESFKDDGILAAYLQIPEIHEVKDGIFRVEIDGNLAPWKGCITSSDYLSHEESILSLIIYPYGIGQSKIKIFSSLTKAYTDYLLQEIIKECGSAENENQTKEILNQFLKQLAADLIQEVAKQTNTVIIQEGIEHLPPKQRINASDTKRFQAMRGANSTEVEMETNEIHPWNKVKDHNWDRKAIEMWWQGYTNKEIGNRICVSARRVTNRISELRQIYGTEIVPTDNQRKKYMREKNL